MTDTRLRRIHYADPNEELDKPFEFQITNIRASDFEADEAEKYYRIQLFGVSAGGHTVHVIIDNFKPYFFVEVPDNYLSINLKIMIKNLKKHMKAELSDYLLEDHCKILLKEKLMGFTNHKKFKFVKLVFRNHEAMRNCMYKFQYGDLSNLTVHESNIEPVMRFLHIRKIEPAGWIRLNDYKNIENGSTCHVYVSASYTDIDPCENQDRMAPIMCCAFDIECTSLDGSFPDPKRASDDCIMIASIFRRVGNDNNESCLKVVHTLKKCEEIPQENLIVIECENEKELLMSWRLLMQTMDPDFIYGYNSNGFDWTYIHERAKRHTSSYKKFMKMSRIKNEQVEFEIKKLASSALGDNTHKFIDMTGRVVLDVMKEIQKEHKLDMFKLDFVAEHFLQSNKVDLSPSELFRKYNKVGTPEAIKEIAIYCIQDTDLCNDLVWKLNIVINAIKMANVCTVPVEYIFYRGQGVKIFSLVAKECRNDNIIIPVIKKPYNLTIEEEEQRKKEAQYQGALVIDTDGGLYYEPVVVLDFNSLYPSCIIRWNISHDTIILDNKYNNIEGIKYANIEYIDYDDKKVICRFVQTGPNGENQGILARILKKLLDTRKDYKNKMKNVSKSSFEYTLLNGSQLAYKVVANSCYGQCGASTSPIYYKKIAACTTSKGREMLTKAKELGEASGLNTECIYGDSVMGYTPILLQDPEGNIVIKTIADLGTEWTAYDNFKIESDGKGDGGRSEKMQSPCNYKVWSDMGWTPIIRVIKHRVANKKIFRIATWNGLVDATEDHSLVKANMELIKPEQCKANTKLLHSFPDPSELHKYTENEKEDLNMFFNGDENAWYYDSQLEAQYIYCVIKAAGFDPYIEHDTSGYGEPPNIYKINMDTEPNTPKLTITRISRMTKELTIDDVVYDLETECGRFQAGIGELIVKNTDSNFYLCHGLADLPKVEKVKKAMDIGHQLSTIINKAIDKKGIINFAYEKVLYPHLQITKKKYYSMLYEDNPEKCKTNGSGLATERRNYCKFSKEIMQGVLDKIMNEEKDTVKSFVEEKLNDLINGSVDLELLRMTQTLKSNYKSPPAHWYLAERMKERGETVNSNDRIPYIFAMHPPVYNTRATAVKKQVKDVIEEYDYVKSQGIDYDPEIYITNQIEEPVLQIMKFIVDDSKQIFNKAIQMIREKKYEKYGQPVKALTKAQLAKIAK